jgi:hypothetical protein
MLKKLLGDTCDCLYKDTPDKNETIRKFKKAFRSLGG